ncbi:Ribosomal protein L14b/L23e [Cynara cardunculus var. scolymus]|uniref:Ribosomal protein L14b/L23e n=1 Tax=Cynara cardunculus var. scolymus TaxID=59895 RepID=A0A118K2J1_CYNCS|nr:Ribosomal protein L14b/L23e [Cynara cardunculus var. scolymus]
MPLERSEVVRAVIVRTCKELKRDNGMIIRYDDNAAVVIDQEGNPKGTRMVDSDTDFDPELAEIGIEYVKNNLPVDNDIEEDEEWEEEEDEEV